MLIFSWGIGDVIKYKLFVFKSKQLLYFFAD